VSQAGPAAGADLLRLLRSLPLAGDALYVGAHPDDEENGLIALLAYGRGVRAVYWSATRGEGGQSRIAPYAGDELGVYRTWESLAARRVDGGEALFGPFYDYGFSKNGAEALEKWGRETLVRELVRAIRSVQPQLVVSRWRGDDSDGHGHHTAVGIAVQEAFAAAGDAARFRELETVGLAPWQPRKLYQSMTGDWQPGEDVALGVRRPDLEAEGCLRVNTGDFDPVLGCTYQEQGTLALNEHLTQGTSGVPTPGDYHLYYRLAAVAPGVAADALDLYDGVDNGLTGLADHPGEGLPELRRELADVQERAREAVQRFRLEQPWSVADEMLELLRRMRRLEETVEGYPLSGPSRASLARSLHRKRGDVEAAAAACLGLRLEATLDRAHLTPGESTRVRVRLWSYGTLAPDDVAFSIDADLPSARVERCDQAADGLGASFDVTVPAEAALSSPYWLRAPHQERVYAFGDASYAGAPFDPPLISATSAVRVGGETLTLSRPALEPQFFAGGFRELAPAILPPVSARATTARHVLRARDVPQELAFSVGVVANRPGSGADGALEIDVPAGWSAEPERTAITLAKAGDADSVPVRVSLPAAAPAGTHVIRYGISCGGRLYDASTTAVMQTAPGLGGHPDEATCLREEFIARPSIVRVDVIDVKVHEQHAYGYVSGVGDQVPRLLGNLGLRVRELPDEELAHGALDAFDTIVVGPNAFVVRGALRKAAQRLLAYVHDGGTLVVQYQGYPHERLASAPFPFHYNQPHDRVTLESAPVRIVRPDHFLLHFPNRIGDGDFADWVRDRGMYFFGDWDARYEPLLGCADPGEEEKLGGLLVATYGLGMYAYCGYTLFRQLPAGVAGAYRLLANLLALPEGRIRRRMEHLRAVSVFETLSEEELHRVAEITRERRLADGEYLCREGEDGADLYLIASGVLEVRAGRPEQKLGVCASGEPIGELAPFTGARRGASLCAAGTTDVFVIHRDDFVQLVHEHPVIGERVIGLLARRLAAALDAAGPTGDGAGRVAVYE
jgi:LmbE family N-acetylglucosaminyl deacetylase